MTPETPPKLPEGFQCPHCKAWHPVGTTICPIFKLPIQASAAPQMGSQAPKLPSTQPIPQPWTPPTSSPKKNLIGLIIGISAAVIILVFVMLIWPFKVIRLSPIAPTSTRRPTQSNYPTQPMLATAVPSTNQSGNGEPAGKGITPAGVPDIMPIQTVKDGIDAGTISDLETLASEQYDNAAYAGNTYTYTVSITHDEKVLFGWGWCAADQTTLKSNLNSIVYTFTMDDKPLPAISMVVDPWSDSSGECQWNGYGLTNWPVGEHHLQIKVEYTHSINDGWGDYAAGVSWHDFTVYVGN